MVPESTKQAGPRRPLPQLGPLPFPISAKPLLLDPTAPEPHLSSSSMKQAASRRRLPQAQTRVGRATSRQRSAAGPCRKQKLHHNNGVAPYLRIAAVTPSSFARNFTDARRHDPACARQQEHLPALASTASRRLCTLCCYIRGIRWWSAGGRWGTWWSSWASGGPPGRWWGSWRGALVQTI